jgi:hypothetical protein
MCDFSVFQKFDLGACVGSIAFGWVPDWFWLLLPYWPWVVVIGGAGMAYRFAGWPGVAAFVGGVGFIAGRRSVKRVTTEEQYGSREPVGVKPPRKRRPTIFDGLRK